jgi:hypothetical protein
VRVSEGPSNETRRQESVEMMTAAIQANPELLQLIGDLYFGAMDDPKMRQIAERLKRSSRRPPRTTTARSIRTA